MALSALRDAWPERPLSAAAEALVLVALLFCPWALGGVAPWAVHAFEALAFAAALLALAEARATGHRLAWGLGGTVIAAMAAITAAQLVPLPPRLVALLAPATDDLLRFTLGPHGQYPAWRPLTLDRPATTFELGKLCGYLAFYLAAAQLGQARASRHRLAAGVGVVGLSLAASAGLHAAFSLHALLGVEALHREGLVTPFVNRNHLCSLLALGALVQLGLAFRTDDRRGAFAWGGGALACGAAALLSGSRAGALGFGAGLAVFLALLGQRAEGDSRLRSRKVALAVTLAAGMLGVAALLNLDQLSERLGSLVSGHTRQEALLRMWPSVVPLVSEHLLTGVGRGAFVAVFPHYQGLLPELTFTHPENVVLQLTAEYGALLGLGLLVLLSGAWAYAARRTDLSAAEAGLLGGLFAVGLHEFADFGLEFVGVAVPALAALAAAEVRPHSRVRLGVAPGGLLTLAAAGLALLAYARAGTPLEEARRQVEAAVASEPVEAVSARAAAALADHPADYLLHLAPALAASRRAPPEPALTLTWANRAMYLAPLSPWPHRLAATALLQLGKRRQALLELNLVYPPLWENDGFRAELLRELRGPEEFADAAPQNAEGFVRAMAVLQHRPQDALQVGELGLARLNREEPELLERMAVVAGNLGPPERSLGYALRALRADPSRPRAAAQAARALSALGRQEEAEHTLRQALEASPGEPDLCRELALLLAATKRPAEAHRLLASANAVSLDQRLEFIDLDANLWAAEGRLERAASALRDALYLRSGDPGRHYALARLLVRQGRLAEAASQVRAGLANDQSHDRPVREAWLEELRGQVDTRRRDELLKPPPAP